MSQESNSQRAPTAKEVLEIVTKLGGVLISVLYVTGLIIVSLDLWQHGFRSADMLRLQYIAAGVWAFIPLVVAWFLLGRVHTFLADSLWSKGWKKVVGWLVAIAFLGVAVASVVTVLYFPDSEWMARQNWVDRMIIMVPFAIVVVVNPRAAVHNLQLHHRLKELAQVGLFKSLKTDISIISIVFWLLIYAVVFTFFVYREIPPALFGGQLREVRLLASGEAQQALAKSGIPFLPGNAQSEPVKLLLDTSEHFVVLIEPGGNLVDVRRDLIESVHYGSGK